MADMIRSSGSLHPRIRSVETMNSHIQPSSILVIIPTYNEKECIGKMLHALNNNTPSPDILVVDDGSPDGTADEVFRISRMSSRRVHLMRRGGKFGLGVAYLDAHQWVLDHVSEFSYQYIIQMDADFSHNPESISALLAEAEVHGVSVGSRYVPGGSAPDWGMQRLFLSFAANTYLGSVLRLFFPKYPIHDHTSGFIAWRRDALESVLQHPIFGDGYSFLTSLKLVAHEAGFTPKEVPITLRDRRVGVSKLNRHIMFEAFKTPWKLGKTFRKKSGTQKGDHDNSVEMWNRYYTSSDETGKFAKLVHWARENYFGDLFARRVIQLGGSSTSYLELGVGTGQTLVRLQQQTGVRCVGIEKTPSAHELGKTLAKDCEMILGDGMNMPFQDASFDTVYSLGLLEHFCFDEQNRLLHEQARVARNVVLIEVPTRSPHMRMILWLSRTILGKKGVWADEELFSKKHFMKKYPNLPFTYYFDWASGCMTCWFVLKPDDIRAYVPR
ncbi:MAG: glycosyltransferase [bacterium]|nr:glycosyltransferase [bacterium]